MTLPAQELSTDAVKDFGLDTLARSMAGTAISAEQILRILSRLETDPDIIAYRSEVLFDLFDHPGLAEGLEEVIPIIREVTLFGRTVEATTSALQQTIWKIGELESYVQCIKQLSDLLGRHGDTLKSRGLQRLKREVDAIRATPSFTALAEDIPKMRAGLQMKKSITLGVNLDAKLRPVEATILSINEQPFHESGVLGRFLAGLGEGGRYAAPHRMLRTPSAEDLGMRTGTTVPLAPLFQEIEQLLRDVLKPLSSQLDRYLKVNTRVLHQLGTQIGFFCAAHELMSRLAEAGLPVTKPVIVPAEKRHTRLTGLYNLQLALRILAGKGEDRSEAVDAIVYNDARFDDQARIFILTGPNQGGKTTFTQGVGLAQVLAQAGLFAPASEAEISPCDMIYTHFPAEERGQLTTGRLGEELSRLHDMFEQISERSMVLMNESLSSTSPGEATVLAMDIVKGLRLTGVRCVYATHLHDLAARTDELNADVAGDSPVASLVAVSEENGEDEEETSRTYRIIPSPPRGQSYAIDIARRYQVRLEDIKALRDARAAGPDGRATEPGTP